ncbi:hypothetical protein FBZ88_107306 [Nitrospirillum bahiense]|uniref:Uncharacterized protein n=1 Tax=Nitrospirillum amazonense TaxID=28077 RepID=A0A560FZR9_9PROT|nr:hypothetical protein FBZ88_107306 [Nitrospirillum amazonense]
MPSPLLLPDGVQGRLEKTIREKKGLRNRDLAGKVDAAYRELRDLAAAMFEKITHLARD